MHIMYDIGSMQWKQTFSNSPAQGQYRLALTFCLTEINTRCLLALDTDTRNLFPQQLSDLECHISTETT